MHVLVLDQCGYVYEMAGKTKTHKAWLDIMRFGLPALVDQQLVIVELVYEEAYKLAQVSGLKPYEEVSAIFEELGLRITLDDNGA